MILHYSREIFRLWTALILIPYLFLMLSFSLSLRTHISQPFCNLDYIFESSTRGLLQPNFVIAGTDAPAAGNFFLLKPGPSEYETLEQRIVQPVLQQHEFDVVTGWGHRIASDDPWRALGYHGSRIFRNLGWQEHGTKWTWHGAMADQGLLYHWVKYVKRNVTIAVGPIIETWKDVHPTVLDDTPVLAHRSSATEQHPFHQLSCWKGRFRFRSKEGLTAPYSDYEHNKKIWERSVLPPDVPSRYDATSPAQFWFHIFRQLASQYTDYFGDWNEKVNWLQHIGNKARPLGKGPKKDDFLKAAGRQ